MKEWIEAMRLRTLPVSVAGVIAGTGCAFNYHGFKLVPAIICLLFAVIAQIASNFANEYYDFRNGLDKKGREGFRRGVTEGDISPRAMKRATYALLLLDSLLGLSLIYFGGWWLIIPGILIALFAVGYSTGPYPLSHHGLGDIAVVIFFGVVPVCLTCYVQTGVWYWSGPAIPISIAVGLLAANVLIVNNYRDCDDDRAVGKRTTVVIFGRRAMAITYLLSGIVASILISVTLYYCSSVHTAWLSLGWITMAIYVALYVKLTKNKGKQLNPLLGKTAISLLAISVLLSLALAF